MAFDLDLLWTIVQIVGSLGGIYYFISLIHKKLWGKVAVLHSGAYIRSMSTTSVETPLGIEAVVTVINHKDSPVALTDLRATLRYDDRQFEEFGLHEMRHQRRFSLKPTKATPSMPINLQPDGAVGIRLQFDFPKTYFVALERYGRALSFEQRNAPDNPVIRMLLSIDTGGEVITHETPIFYDEKEMNEHGTINVVKLDDIERSWR